MTFLAAGGNCRNGTKRAHASCQTLTERGYFSPNSEASNGIVNPADAHKVIDLGTDGIVVSSRGGRQLDRVVNTLQVLEAVRAEVDPEVEIIYDSGVMSGVDIAIALALGADFVLIGRAYLYGLMAGGKEGVDRVIKLLASEFKNTL